MQAVKSPPKDSLPVLCKLWSHHQRTAYRCYVSGEVATEVFVMIFHIEAETEENVVPEKHLHPGRKTTHKRWRVTHELQVQWCSKRALGWFHISYCWLCFGVCHQLLSALRPVTNHHSWNPMANYRAVTWWGPEVTINLLAFLSGVDWHDVAVDYGHCASRRRDHKVAVHLITPQRKMSCKTFVTWKHQSYKSKTMNRDFTNAEIRYICCSNHSDVIWNTDWRSSLLSAL